MTAFSRATRGRQRANRGPRRTRCSAPTWNRVVAERIGRHRKTVARHRKALAIQSYRERRGYAAALGRYDRYGQEH
jgi:hypothetical protein